MRMKLTDQAINKAARDAQTNGKRRELTDAGCPGLRIRITPGGARTWVLGTRDQFGRARRFQLGSYPAMGIADARDAARAMHHKVRHEGADPILERRRSIARGKAARAGLGTLKALLDTYSRMEGVAPRSWPTSRRRVEVVFRALLDHPLGTLTLQDLQLQADNYSSASSAAFAVRTLRPVLRWASAPGRAYVSLDLGRLSSPASIKPRRRVLSVDELRALLPCLKNSKRPHAVLMRFLLLTLSRREEAAKARWDSIDWNARTWTIPEPKNGKQHVVPLSRQAVELLETIGPGEPLQLIFRTGSGTKLGNWDRETKALQKVTGTRGWHRHDLRRTGATMLGELGVLPDIVEAALNHVAIRSPLAVVYNQARYRPQVAEALQRLADKLDEIEPSVMPKAA